MKKALADLRPDDDTVTLDVTVRFTLNVKRKYYEPGATPEQMAAIEQAGMTEDFGIVLDRISENNLDLTVHPAVTDGFKVLQPRFCPRCGNPAALVMDVDDGLVDQTLRVIEPQSGAHLAEHQCLACDGASFWM